MALAQAGNFAPLLLGAPLSLLSAVLVHMYMTESVDLGKEHKAALEKEKRQKRASLAQQDAESKSGESEHEGPTQLDRKKLWGVIFGAWLDNIGSSGMQLTVNPVFAGAFLQTALITVNGFKWINILVARPRAPPPSVAAFHSRAHSSLCSHRPHVHLRFHEIRRGPPRLSHPIRRAPR